MEARDKDKPGTPPEAEPTPEEQITALNVQIKTLKVQLEILEAEKKELSKGYERLEDRVNKQVFIEKKQAEQLNILKMAAVERNLHKTRADRLEKKLADLRARGRKPRSAIGGDKAASQPATGPVELEDPATQPRRD